MNTSGKPLPPVAHLVDLAQAHFQAGRKYEAYGICADLLARNFPQNPQTQSVGLGAAWGRLSGVCSALGDVDGALIAVRRFLAFHPKDLAARGRLAEWLGEVGQIDEAISVAQQLLSELQARNGPTAGLINGLGYFFAQKGDFERALDYYRAALKAAPEETFSWEQLSAIKRFKQGDPDIEAMEALYGAAGSSSEAATGAMSIKNRIHLTYALGKAYEDLGAIDKAFACVATGARLAATHTPYNAKQYEEDISAIQERFAEPPGPIASTNEQESLQPIFVLGVPRSGTSLVEQILASHPDVCGGGEMKILALCLMPLGDLMGPETARFLASGENARSTQTLRHGISKTYRKLVRQRFGETPFVTDKNLTNAIYVGVIARVFPEAKFVYCRRDPIDLAWSVFKKNFSTRLSWSNDLTDIAHFIRVYEKLMDFWREQMPTRILSISYEELVEAPGPWTDQMLAFCGLTKNEACYVPHKNSRTVATASLAQVRQPIYRSAVGSARAYLHHLQPFIDAYASLCGKEKGERDSGML